jgi:ATP-binding cassette subfamily B protein
VKRIAALSGVDEMIRSLPRGYDTLIGRTFGEHELSGGQWQSIAVARAFARDAALLILDEPTSNLDARAEYNLFRRFQELASGRTTIIISHRFSTVRVADRILVLEKGKVVESGSHDELMAQAGGYKQLYDLHVQRLQEPR